MKFRKIGARMSDYFPQSFTINTGYDSDQLKAEFAINKKIYQVSGQRSGVDVMIIIFCDFRQFSAKKLAFFSKTNVIIKIFAKTSSSLSKKRQYFRYIFRRKLF
jgi:hypothetical protein